MEGHPSRSHWGGLGVCLLVRWKWPRPSGLDGGAAVSVRRAYTVLFRFRLHSCCSRSVAHTASVSASFPSAPVSFATSVPVSISTSVPHADARSRGETHPRRAAGCRDIRCGPHLHPLHFLHHDLGQHGLAGSGEGGAGAGGRLDLRTH